MSAATPQPLTGRHVLAIVLAFFTVVFAVNAAFVWFALESWTGLETENAYVEGLNYDKELQRAEAQRALGWRLQHGWAGRAFEVRLLDASAKPVGGVELSAVFRRPTHEGEDASVVLQPHGVGLYRSETLRLAPGQWDLLILVRREGMTVFRREDRVWIE